MKRRRTWKGETDYLVDTVHRVGVEMTARGGRRPGAGRPKKSDSKSAKLDLRTTPEKLRSWREAASRAGAARGRKMTLTEWVETALDREAKGGGR